MGDRDLDRGAVQPVPVGHEVGHDVGHGADLGDGDLGVLDAFEAAQRDDVAVVVDALDLLAGDHLDDGAQGGLHDAAGGAEDDAGAGGRAERVVEVGLRQGRHVEAGLLEHLGELTRGETVVDVLVAGVAHLGPVALELLGRARHERDAHDVRRVQVQLFGVVGLDERAEHLLRALGRRGVGQVLGVEVLEELDPARRAARELRQGDRLVFFDERLVETQDELGAFFDDGEVGREVGVEHAVEAGPPQGSVHLKGHAGARLEAEALAHRRARRRSGLDDDVLAGIVDGRPDGVGLVFGVERRGRAAVDALPAVDADDLAERTVAEGRDLGRVAAADRFEHAHLLQVDAGAHAAPAADALVHVAHDRVARGVDFGHRRLGMSETEVGDAVFLGQGLELTVAVALTRVALAVVFAEQQLEHVAARQAHAAAVGVDRHLVGDGEDAGRLQQALAFDFDHADPADAGHVEVGVVAEGRDVDADALGGLQDGRAERYLGLDAVDLHGDGGADGVGARGRDHAPCLL